MGIHGLWQVLEPTGRPVNIHSLRGKVLAVDVSIWLHQLVKGFRDKDGNPLPNAHLLGIFHRVCKLLNDGIKPVFVFDGGVPMLKRQTLAARRQRKIESLDKAEVSRQKILNAYLRQQLQRQAKIKLPPSLRMQAQIDALSVSPIKRKVDTSSQSPSKDDVSKIDEDLVAFRAALIAKLEDDVDEVNPQIKNSVSESDDEEHSPSDGYHYGVDYSENFSVIQAPEFDTLPLETQHEILFEMQESRKMNSWGKFEKMPKDLQSFSSFQMDRLVKRRTLQKKIQSVQQEMGQRHIHVQNLDDLLKMDYSDFEDKQAEITGSRDDGFLLIKSQPPSKGKTEKEEPKPGTSASAKEPEIITIDDFIEDSSSDNESTSFTDSVQTETIESSNSKTKEHIGTSPPSDEEDTELKLAIELSLRDLGQNETSKQDGNGKDNVDVTATKYPRIDVSENYNVPNDPKNSFSENNENADEEQKKDLISAQFSQLSHCAKFLDTVGFYIPQSQSKSLSETENGCDLFEKSVVSTPDSKKQNEFSAKTVEESNCSESDNDDDFEEVGEENQITSIKASGTVATIDLAAIKSLAPDENDMFADIFLEKAKNPESAMYNAEDKHESILTTATDVTQPVVLSPSKPNFEEKWDSDSEIEADLMEMVMKETAVSETFKVASGSLTGNKHSNASYNDMCKEKASTSANHVLDSGVRDNTNEKQDVPVRMITADYMQAQEQLNSKLGKLHSEMGQQERIATSISDQMQLETQELIALFGIPYIISPTEAESQCAFLDRACLTDGTITDDSDVWLFGGQRVYKNFFSQGQKHVELYQAADIQRVLNLDREKLIVLAIMIGSDYSDGIQGVGPVLGLEILSEFASTEVESFEILLKFREWWDEIQSKPLDLFAGSKLREKLRKLKLRPGFPSKAVYDAFVNPTIDTSTEKIKWGNPDLDAIRTYTKQKFGWEQSKCDSLLLPVLKKRQCEPDQSRQLTLDSYISFGKMPSLNCGKRKKGSKRIQTAVKRLKRVGLESHELNLSSESDSDVETETRTKKPALQKQATKRVVHRKENNSLTGENVDTRNKHQVVTASSSSVAASTSSSSPNRLTPKKAEVIPQRVQSESDKIKNKQKAIEIFSKTKRKPQQ